MTTPPTLPTRDGLALHLRHWPAAPGTAARGRILLVHGLGEHVGRYERIAAELNAQGWEVAGYDLRGHGRSEGAKGRVSKTDDMLSDLAAVIDSLRSELPKLPLLLLGHSMGGLIAARFVAEQALPPDAPRAAWARPVDALVLSSPALALDMNGVQKLLLAVMGTLAPDFAVNNGLDPAWISRDPAVVAAYKADPLVHDRVTAKLVRFMLEAGEVVRQRAATWATPTLLIWAGSDRCVAPRGSAQFAAASRAAPPGIVSAREFAPLYHEIFNEPQKQEVFAVLLDWLARLELTQG